MKKIILLCFFSVLTTSVLPQLNFFAEAGINAAKPNNKSRQKGAATVSARAGYIITAGLVGKINDRFSLNNRLSFLSKSYHFSYFVGPDFSGTNDYTLTGLQNQFVVEYKLAGKKNFQLLTFAGGYTTLHLGGTKHYTEITIAGEFRGVRKLNYSQFGDFNQWEAGTTLGCRAQWKKISISALTNIGMTKVKYNDNEKWIAGQFEIGYFLR